MNMGQPEVLPEEAECGSAVFPATWVAKPGGQGHGQGRPELPGYSCLSSNSEESWEQEGRGSQR